MVLLAMWRFAALLAGSFLAGLLIFKLSEPFFVPRKRKDGPACGGTAAADAAVPLPCCPDGLQCDQLRHLSVSSHPCAAGTCCKLRDNDPHNRFFTHAQGADSSAAGPDGGAAETPSDLFAPNAAGVTSASAAPAPPGDVAAAAGPADLDPMPTLESASTQQSESGESDPDLVMVSLTASMSDLPAPQTRPSS